MVKNLPCSAGDVGLIPGQGSKIPHTSGTTKPAPHNYRSLQAPEPTSHNQGACAPQHKVLHDTTRTPRPQLRPTAAKRINKASSKGVEKGKKKKRMKQHSMNLHRMISNVHQSVKKMYRWYSTMEGSDEEGTDL